MKMETAALLGEIASLVDDGIREVVPSAGNNVEVNTGSSHSSMNLLEPAPVAQQAASLQQNLGFYAT